MKRWLSVLLVAMLVLTGLSASAAAPEGRRPVVFWHCFGGTIGEAIQVVIDNFNASQDEIFVEGIFQGTYDECLTKLKADIPQGTGPDMWQMFELGTTFLVSSGYAIPFQEMLEKDPYITIDDIEPALRRYYTYDGQMVCIPFNPSTPIMYYNKTAFDAAGITDVPTTFKEIAALADQLTVKEGNRITRYPMGLSIYGWFFENFLAGMGANYVNNDNGRTDIATAIEFDTNGAGKQVLETWKQLVDDEVIYNYGANNDAARAGFVAEQTCITLESTAQMTSLLKAIDGKFELGTAYLPSMLDETEYGVMPELRAIFQAEMELVLEDVQSIDDALAAMATADNAAIANYNTTVYGK